MKISNLIAVSACLIPMIATASTGTDLKDNKGIDCNASYSTINACKLKNSPLKYLPKIPFDIAELCELEKYSEKLFEKKCGRPIVYSKPESTS